MALQPSPDTLHGRALRKQPNVSYQQISSMRSTRYPFMGGIGCACGTGMGALAPSAALPMGWIELENESNQLFSTANRLLGRVPWNPAVWSQAYSKLNEGRSAQLTPIEVIQLVNGSAILVATVRINAKSIWYGPHGIDPSLSQAITNTISSARRLIYGIGQALSQVASQRRGMSGLGAAAAAAPTPSSSNFAVDELILLATGGVTGLAIGAVLHFIIDEVTVSIIKIETSRTINSLSVENERCARLLQDTGQPCSLQDRQQVFTTTMQSIAENSPLAQTLNAISHFGDGLLDPLRDFSKGIMSTIKTIAIIGAVGVGGYFLFQWWLSSRARRLAGA